MSRKYNTRARTVRREHAARKAQIKKAMRAMQLAAGDCCPCRRDPIPNGHPERPWTACTVDCECHISNVAPQKNPIFSAQLGMYSEVVLHVDPAWKRS